MKSRSASLHTTASLLSICLCATSWAAQPVTITNAGFENPVTTDGTLGAAPLNWTLFNGATVNTLNPSTFDLSLEAPEGQNVGLVTSNNSENGISQTLATPFWADAAYTLSVKVANTKVTTGFPGYRVQLVVNGTVIAEDDNSLSVAEDAVVTSTVNYTYNPGLHASLVGQPLEIRLLSKGITASEEVGFDDVQLSATLVNPLAQPAGPYSVFAGGSLVLNGSASLPSDGATITSYEWDLDNDGDYDEAITGANPAPIADTVLTGTYGMSLGGNTIKLRVTDSAAKVSEATTAVNLLPSTAVIYEPFNYPGTALNGQSGTSEVGLTGTWAASADSKLGPNRFFGSLVTRGAGIGDLITGANRYGGARPVSASALAGNGLLADGVTLWFSLIMGYDTGGNVTNSRLGFCLATESFSTNNFAYFFPTAGAEGLGVTLGNLSGNGRVAATKFRDSTFGTGFNGNQLGTLSSALFTAGQSGLIVGKITWGAASDTIELYRPGADLVLPATPISTFTTSVNQAAFDTITWARGDKVVMDEIRFGASYAAVIETGSAWDLNGDTAGSGSTTPSGTWNSDAIWNLAPDGTLVPIPWQPGSVATFAAGTDATGSYNVTVDGTQDFSGLLFEEGTVTVSGGTALRMTKNTTVSVGTALTATIATPLTESTAGLQMTKAGAGTLVLSGSNAAATGGFTLAAGLTRFESPAAINGTARNVAIGSSGTLMFGPGFGAANIPAALLDRVTANSAGAIAADNYASTNFDFGAAGLTAASLGAVGNVSYTGTLTQQGTTYRLGGGGGTITIENANAITGANALVVNGNTTLAQNNDYTGTTTINAGSTLTVLGSSTTSGVTLGTPNTTLVLGTNSSLGTGTLTVQNSFAGPGTLAAIGTVVTTNPVTAATDFNFGGTGALTLGPVTVTGARTITNNNTTSLSTITSITSSASSSLAFSGNGNTTVTGNIGGGSGITTLTKNGNGTLTLQGVNTHTGATTVNNGGTLALVSPASLPAGAVTLNNTSTLTGNGSIGGSVTVTATANIAPGNAGVGTLPITGGLTVSAMAASTGTLRYDLGAVGASDQITVGGTLAIGNNVLGLNNFVFTTTGGFGVGTYKLITATTALTGTIDPANASGTIAGFNATLQVNGNDVELVVTPGASPYAAWSGGAAADIDTNGDGVANGVAWALGAADPNVNAIGLLPTLDTTTDPAYLIFEFDRSDAAFADTNTAITVEYGDSLAGWTTAVDDDNNVDIIVTPGTPSDTVQVKLKRSSLGPAGRLFARLKVIVTP